jgi:hypothetical protein
MLSHYSRFRTLPSTCVNRRHEGADALLLSQMIRPRFVGWVKISVVLGDKFIAALVALWHRLFFCFFTTLAWTSGLRQLWKTNWSDSPNLYTWLLSTMRTKKVYFELSG